MMDEALQKLIDFVEQAAPVMWEASYRQSYVVAIRDLLFFIGMMALAVYCARWYFHFGDLVNVINEKIAQETGWSSGLKTDRENAQLARGIFAFLVIVIVGAAILVVGGVIGRIINPDYYAIQNLIGLIP